MKEDDDVMMKKGLEHPAASCYPYAVLLISAQRRKVFAPARPGTNSQRGA
jgi:hypothetical protein